MDVIQPGKHVILRDVECNQKVVLIPPNGAGSIRFGKITLPVSAIIGARYGSTFRLENSSWVRRKPISLAIHDAQESTIDTAVNNSDLAQNNTAQQLSHEQITGLKEAVSGEELVQKIVANSSTFESKTTFSQQKYIAKKQKKHIQQVTLLYPRLMDVCETHFLEGQRTCFLRFDMLSSLVYQAAVGLGDCRCFVLDHASGLVTGAVAQRLGGRGVVYRAFEKAANDKIISELDLPEESLKTIHNLPLSVIQSENPLQTEWLTEPIANSQGSSEQVEKRIAKRRLLWERRMAEFKEFKETSFDSMVACVDDREAFETWFSTGFTRLRSCGTLCCYFHDMKDAMTLYTRLRRDERYVFVKLQEFLLREFQVLPQRTHPVMNQSAALFSGFLVSATKTNHLTPPPPPKVVTPLSVPSAAPVGIVPPVPPVVQHDSSARTDASPKCNTLPTDAFVDRTDGGVPTASVPTSPSKRVASVPRSPSKRTASVPKSPSKRTASLPTSPSKRIKPEGVETK